LARSQKDKLWDWWHSWSRTISQSLNSSAVQTWSLECQSSLSLLLHY